jgi:hypothetical protein
MQRTTMFLLGALLAISVVVVVWLVWFSPRGYTTPDCPGGIMSVGENDETTVQYVVPCTKLWQRFSRKVVQ